MAFKSLKNHISNLATPFLANVANNFVSKQGAKDAGKVAASLKQKSPFNIDQAPSAKLVQNPLSFSPVQYPLDLGNEQLGHYIIFESGFLGYSPQTSPLISAAGRQKKKRVNSKLSDKSITTAAIAIYMPPSIKVSYAQNYDTDTAGIAGDLEAMKQTLPADNSAEQIKAFLPLPLPRSKTMSFFCTYFVGSPHP